VNFKSIVNSIKNKNFLRKVKNKIYANIGKFELSKNRIIINKANQDKCLRRYRKNFRYVIDNFKYDSSIKQQKSKIIWCFWYQGLDNAPDIVKKCIESQKKYALGYDLKIITNDNINDYIELPDYILKKFERGIISLTHFSDIIRISLLAEYGGIWLDSTVFLTDYLPDYITNNKLFVFKNIELDRSDESPVVASSWLISSFSNQKIILLTRDLLFEYWKKKNKLDDYFTFHIFFKIVTDFFEKEWENVPTYSNINPHILFFEYLREFNEDRFNDIKKISSIHKLDRRAKNEDKRKIYIL